MIILMTCCDDGSSVIMVLLFKQIVRILKCKKKQLSWNQTRIDLLCTQVYVF